MHTGCYLLARLSKRSSRVNPSMRCGHPPAGVHLIMWGTMASNGQLDMTIGAPATTLARAGIAGLPAEFVLAIPVHGTREAPLVNWTRSAPAGVLKGSQ